MDLKERSFIISLILFPFNLGIFILRIINFFKSNIYDYVIIILSIIFIFYFIVCLFYTVDEILNSSKKLRIILLLLFPFLYLPFYYGKYISNKEKILSYSIIILNLLLIIGFYLTFKNKLTNYIFDNEKVIVKEEFNYVDKLGLFTILINKNYVCDYLEGYDLTCDDNSNDSFIGIYTYEEESFSEGKKDDIKDFHIDEIISYIKENNYTYNEEEIDDYIKITYNDMAIILKSILYNYNNKEYLLIIIKESPDYEDNIIDLEKIIETITFIN